MNPLSIGLNLVYLHADSGGSGTYARELIRGILAVEPDTRITAFVSTAAPASVLDAEWAQAVDWVRFPFEESGGRPWTGALTVASQWAALPALAARRRLDVVHGLANVVPPVSLRTPTVVTLLDLIWLRHPNTMERRARIAMKLLGLTSVRRADRVIAISEVSRQDLVTTIGLPAERIDVTHLGVRVDERVDATSESELRSRLGLDDSRVVLCVAQKREHKNLHGLVRGFARAGESLRLVLPGSPTAYERTIEQLAVELGVSDRVHLPGWVSEADLEGLYRLASCFVLPSFEEGFGIPILEAMGRGVPVACSNTSSLPEIAGDAAVLFDPRRPEEIGAAIARVLGGPELRERLIERGRARARRFSWDATAAATLKTYRRTIAGER